MAAPLCRSGELYVLPVVIESADRCSSSRPGHDTSINDDPQPTIDARGRAFKQIITGVFPS
jgi:hypothetical protein